MPPHPNSGHRNDGTVSDPVVAAPPPTVASVTGLPSSSTTVPRTAGFGRAAGSGLAGYQRIGRGDRERQNVSTVDSQARKPAGGYWGAGGVSSTVSAMQNGAAGVSFIFT